MSFLAPDYYDRELPLTKEDRKEVRRQTWKRWFAQRVNLSLYIVVIVAVNVIAESAWRAFKRGVGQPAWWHWVIAGLLIVIVLYATLLLLQRWRFAPLARRVVREQGFNICLKCGRWLKDSPRDATTCPRCGAPMESV